MVQLTKSQTCKKKHTYYTSNAAKSARARRNKAAGLKYLRSYRCNICNYWHVTTQVKEEELCPTNPYNPQ